ncbi:hypothetical protein B296_00026849 [Ensete ventricosum]|uniref:Uncharacterized protein n=1 Tax=Ensete ventricosum TaxID=4639 RepID=A0A426ZH08_ENSVE|nr:hypothetical protein B296_00026849 [Ensete ventricosum]
MARHSLVLRVSSLTQSDDPIFRSDVPRPRRPIGEGSIIMPPPPGEEASPSRSEVCMIVMQSSSFTRKPSIEAKSSLEGMVRNESPRTRLRARLEVIDTESPRARLRACLEMLVTKSPWAKLRARLEMLGTESP